MPPEIADSDAESDIGSPPRPPVTPVQSQQLDARQLDPSEPDPVLDLQFSQFLSPTQRLSSAIQEQDGPLPRSSGSTDQFLQEMRRQRQDLNNSLVSNDHDDENCHHDAAAHKAKRRFSELENDKADGYQGEMLQQPSMKRAKSYGSQMSTADESPDLISTGAQTSFMNDLHHRGTSDDIQAIQQIKSLKTGALQKNGFGQKVVQNGSHNGYHGISLDFRNGSNGADVHANPFGSLSQASLDGEVDSAEVKRFIDLFANKHHAAVTTPVETDIMTPEAAKEDYERNSIRSQPSQDSNLLIVESKRKEQVQSNLLSRQAENEEPVEVLEGISHPAGRGDVDVQASKHSAPQRPGQQGRKQKKRKSDNDLDMVGEVSQPQVDEDLDDSEQIQKDDVQLQFESSTRPNGKKSKGKAEKKQITPEKNASSELGLNDPDLVGMPKEVYHAKPSRSRSRTLDAEKASDTITVDAEDTLMPTHESSPSVVDQAKSTKKSKRQRKKQGKTSNTSTGDMVPVLPKSTDGHADNQNEQISGTTEDAAGVVDVSKRNHTAETSETISAAGSNNANPGLIDPLEASNMKAKQISIDIPNFNEVLEKTTASKTKRRGRKAKDNKVADRKETLPPPEVLNDETVPEEQEEVSGTTASECLVLGEQDPNTTYAAVKESSQSSQNEVKNGRLLQNKGSGDTAEMDGRDDENVAPASAKALDSEQPVSPQKQASIISKPLPMSSGLFNQNQRVGLSRKMRIPSLLRKLDRNKEPPKVHERKEKLTKKQQEAEDKRRLEAQDAEGDDSGIGMWSERGADGMLVEWDD